MENPDGSPTMKDYQDTGVVFLSFPVEGPPKTQEEASWFPRKRSPGLSGPPGPPRSPSWGHPGPPDPLGGGSLGHPSDFGSQGPLR